MMEFEVPEGCKKITVTVTGGGGAGTTTPSSSEYMGRPGIFIRLKLYFLRLIGKYPPIIQTDFGPVTESARRQAALNMIEDSNLRESVLQLLVRQAGSREAGLERARRNYPEVSWPKE